MLFVPQHGDLHRALCEIKEDASYFNKSPKHSARYKELHFTRFKTRRDVDVAKKWIDAFLESSAYFRSVVIDWSLWDAKYFGDHLRARFTQGYEGLSPYIDEFRHTDSRKDANQCLQLCDVLTTGLYQSLVPAERKEKLAVRDYLAEKLKNHNVRNFRAEFWKQYDKSTLNQHFPKYSAWFWKPSREGKQRRKKKRR